MTTRPRLVIVGILLRNAHIRIGHLGYNGNVADWLNATQAARFGLISLDWSIAYEQWRPKGTPCNATTGAATLVEQCRRIKAVNPTTKCFVCVCGCSSPAAVAAATGLHPPYSYSHSARYTFRAQVPQH